MNETDQAFEPQTPISGIRGVTRRFVLRLVHGDLTRRRADCFVINHYAGLQVSGVARAVDQYMGGTINRLAARGVLDTPPGSIYFVPARYAPISADMVAVLSMGEYERFLAQDVALSDANSYAHEQLRLFGYRVATSCCEVDLRNVASSLHGTGQNTQLDPLLATRYYLAGYVQGLMESAHPGETYFLTLVELDAAKLEQIRQGIEEAIEEGVVGTMQGVGIIGTDAVGVSEPRVWMVDLDTRPEPEQIRVPRHLRLGSLLHGNNQLKLSIIGTGSADQVIFDDFSAGSINSLHTLIQQSNSDILRDLFELETLQNETADGDIETRSAIRHKLQIVNDESKEQILVYGNALFDQLFDPTVAGSIRQRLQARDAKTLLLRLDESTATIPWELLADERGLFALTRNIGRQLELVGQVRQPAPRPDGATRRLRVLIVANPTGDLPQVEVEARRILEQLYALESIEIQLTALFGEEAQLQYLIPLLKEHFDIFHYAGHAYFHPERPNESGLLLANGDVFTADMMWALPTPPGLVFFNACESAAAAAAQGSARQESIAMPEEGEYAIELPLGTVSALLRAGTQNFIGTTWPVEDHVAAEMAIACYAELAAGRSVGEALRLARHTTIDKLGFGHFSWASYLLYGSPWNRLINS